MHGFQRLFSQDDAICMGFLAQCDLGMLFAWVLRLFRSFIGDINALCIGFTVILRSVCYMHGF